MEGKEEEEEKEKSYDFHNSKLFAVPITPFLPFCTQKVH